MNWDVLQSALADWMLPNADQRLAEFANTMAPDISRLLADYPKQDRVRARERAGILRQTAKQLTALRNAGALSRLFADPVLEGPDGFYALIFHLDAYASDPVEKKARVLAHDLYRENILAFLDPQNLKPAVEYHLIRLYLRSGRVFPTDPSVRELLIGPRPEARQRLVRVLRETVDEAMRQTAFYAGLDVANLNYLEWQLARSLCISELNPAWHPLCENSATAKMPVDVEVVAQGQCPFADGCRARTDLTYGWYHEPQFEKAIY
jgi:hypothetical protein